MLGHEFGRLNPAWSFVGETVTWLLRPQLCFDSDHRVTTWALFAETGDTGERLLNGVAGKLTVERVAPGCGAVYPHPSADGFLRTDHEFSTAIQYAFLAARQLDARLVNYDFRWTIELADMKHIPLQGPSASLPFAASLLASAKHETLDQHVASTGQIKDAANGHFSIAPVGDVLCKTTAQALKDNHVEEVLVAFRQPIESADPVTSKVPLGGSRLHAVPVETLQQAYDRMALFPRMTRLANKSIAKHAKEYLKKHCGRYVLSPLARPPTHKEQAQREAACRRNGGNTSREDDVLLSRRETRNMVLARTADKRVRFVADSGMGKTMFLAYCERQIARQQDGRLPIRLPHLNHLHWKDFDSLVSDLMSRAVLGQHVPEEYRPYLQPWMEWLLKNGCAVFLLDALDQTTLSTVRSMPHPLADVQECHVYLTTREHALSGSKATLFDSHSNDGAWSTVRILGFDRKRKKRFLGPKTASRLLLAADLTRPGDTLLYDPDGDARKEQWQPLLEVPLLLQMLKELAVNHVLDSLTNRYSVYVRAVTSLIAKGLDSKKHSTEGDDAAVQREGQVNSWLGRIAWWMVANGNFDTVIRDEAFEKMCHELCVDQQLESLLQVNVFTEFSLLDAVSREGLAWRHRSLLEYFAGRELAASAGDYAEMARKHARNGDWKWVFRFALSHLHADGNQVGLVRFAEYIIAFGNPFLVMEAIRDDGLRLDAELERLCRFLTCRHDRHEWCRPPTLTERTIELLRTLFQREHRNGRCLHAACELVTLAQSETEEEVVRRGAAKIAAEFLAEFAKIIENPDVPAYCVAQNLLASFVYCPGDDHDNCISVPSNSPREEEHAGEDARHQVVVSPFELMDFPVTNEQYELFDPHHMRDHDKSTNDDQPVIGVTWHEAETFCCWLGIGYRLPTMAEWEYACRTGKTANLHVSHDQGNFDNRIGKTTRRGQFPANAWGLYDMLGNVWEWCNINDRGSVYGSLRGGSFHHDPETCWWNSSDDRSLAGEYGCYGFRVARGLPCLTHQPPLEV